MEDIKKLSNTDLIKMMETLHKNHEKIKLEILALVEIDNIILKDFNNINEELKSRI